MKFPIEWVPGSYLEVKASVTHFRVLLKLKKKRHWTYDVTLRRVRVTIVDVEKR
jgi:hypothetical protein